MKSQNAFWSTIMLLVALGIGGCMLEVTQQEGPTAEQSSQEPQKEEAGG